MRRSLSLVLVLAVLACAPRRLATVPYSPSDALTRATRILESFEYNVVEVDREAGLVRGMRSSGRLARGVLAASSDSPDASREVLWEVTVHVTPADAGSHYRLESRATALESVDQTHLDRILRVLADWRR